MRPQKTRMEQAAETLYEEIQRLLPRAKEADARLADHLERTAISILLNTAEGGGSIKPKVKVRAYDIARAESHELRAILRAYTIKRVFTLQEIGKAYNVAGVCIRMLTNAMISLQKAPTSAK